jgi:predicted adenylyl cyclase CyaB
VLEVEQKFRLADPAERERLLALLRGRAAAGVGQTRQTDVYYSPPDRDLYAAGEALRIRVDDQGTTLCWKGRRHPGPVKTREEIELTLAKGDDERARTMLERLGFVEVGRVAKTRTEFEFPARHPLPGALRFALDEVDGLGWFVEIEMLVEAADSERASRAIAEVATELGLGVAEPRSYLKMLSGGSAE